MSPRTQPHPSADDIADWRRLVFAAEGAAQRPESKTAAVELRRAADRANCAVCPTHDTDLRAPFLRLLGFAKAWGAMSPQLRASNAEPMVRWSMGCTRFLDAAFPQGATLGAPGAAPDHIPEPGDPGYRADVHG